MISRKKHFRKPTILTIGGERLTGRRVEDKETVQGIKRCENRLSLQPTVSNRKNRLFFRYFDIRTATPRPGKLEAHLS